MFHARPYSILFRTLSFLPVALLGLVSCSTDSHDDSVCGDSMVAGSEACDDGEQTASCNVDCTLSMCGDGVVNALADEACDDVALPTADCRADCSLASCGNGVVDAGEACDSSGADSASCDANCSVPMCGDDHPNMAAGEACDDAGESATCDTDCSPPICGDGIVNASAGETCDGGADCGVAGSRFACERRPVAFRLNSLAFVDPHLYSGIDLTSIINDNIIAPSVTTDQPYNATLNPTDQNGLIDNGFVFAFAGLPMADGQSVDAEFQTAHCEPNDGPCSGDAVPPIAFRATRHASGSCLDVLPGTTTADYGATGVTAGADGCWSSETVSSVTITLPHYNLSVPLTEVQIASQFTASADGLVAGVLRGFLSDEVAQATQIPAGLPIIGGKLLSDLFSPDGTDDRDTNAEGVSGYYFYLSFTAVDVAWEGGDLCGNGSVDPGETCDPSVQGSCVLQCDDGNVCTSDTYVDGDPCHPTCFHFTMNRSAADGCCPSIPGDADCVAECGNGNIEHGEVCDSGGGSPTTCPQSCDDGNMCTTDSVHPSNACYCRHPSTTPKPMGCP